MGTYTTDQYISKLDKSFLSLQKVKPHVEILAEVIRRQQDRVFNKGMDGNGKAIGLYSTKPTYISINKLPRKLTPTGKKPAKGRAKSTFKNGKMHTSRYFSGGYAEMKVKVGKGGGGRVNLWLFGHFRTAYLNSIKNPYTAVSSNSIRVKTFITPSVFNPQGKIDGIFDPETGYPFIFDLTRGEKKYVIDRSQKLLTQTFQ